MTIYRPSQSTSLPSHGRPTISPAIISPSNTESCVVVAVRPSVRGQSIVDYAFSGILRRGDRLVMLHVLNSIPSMPPLPSGEDGRSTSLVDAWKDAFKQQASQSIAHLLMPYRRKCRDCQIDVQIRIVERTNIGKALLTEAAALRASTLVVGSSGRSTITRQLHGPARECLRRPPPSCTVHVLSEGEVVVKDSTASPHSSPTSIFSPLLEKEAIPVPPPPRPASSLSPHPTRDGDPAPRPPTLRGTESNCSPAYVTAHPKPPPSSRPPTSCSSSASFPTPRPTEHQATLRGDSAPLNSRQSGYGSFMERYGSSNFCSPKNAPYQHPPETEDLYPNTKGGGKQHGLPKEGGGHKLKVVMDCRVDTEEVEPEEEEEVGEEERVGEEEGEEVEEEKEGAKSRWPIFSPPTPPRNPTFRCRPQSIFSATEPLVINEGAVITYERMGGGEEEEEEEVVPTPTVGFKEKERNGVAKVGHKGGGAQLVPRGGRSGGCDDSMMGVRPRQVQDSKAGLASLMGMQEGGSHQLPPLEVQQESGSKAEAGEVQSGDGGLGSEAGKPTLLLSHQLVGAPIPELEEEEEEERGYGSASPGSARVKQGHTMSRSRGSFGSKGYIQGGGVRMRRADLSGGPQFFHLEELSYATNGFAAANLVGRGGYAEVFKGTLSSGARIAVKRLVVKANEETQFLREVGVVSHVSHPNCTTLLGYCMHDSQRLMVYELMPHGSLERKLHSQQVAAMEWDKRVKVLTGAACGLAYLHAECARKMVHGDVKSGNILLRGRGTEWTGQIADFGLSKWVPAETEVAGGAVEGTIGYMAPECFLRGELNEKTDVYAFGVTMLETMSGRRPMDLKRPAAESNLVGWAKPYLEQGEVEAVLDPRMVGEVDQRSLRRVAAAVLMCLRKVPGNRPTMPEVAQFLAEEDLDHS